jgi:hypothetical protein
MSSFETSSQRLEQIRDGFGLNFSGLAELFAVNRTTIYGWLKGEHRIGDSEMILLERLEPICFRWQSQTGYFSGLVLPLHQRVAGQTVLEILRNAPLQDVERVLTLALVSAARSFERNRNLSSADLVASIDVVRPERSERSEVIVKQ